VHDAPRRASRVAFVAVGVVLLGVAAWSASRAANDSAPDLPKRGGGNDAVWNNLFLLMAGAGAAALLIYIAPILARQGRRPKRMADEEEREVPLWLRLLLGSFAILAAVGLLLLLTRNKPQTENLFAQAPTTTTAPAADQSSSDGAGAHGWAALGLFGAGAAAVVVGLVWWNRRGRGGGAIDDAFDDLDLAGPAVPIDLASLPPAEAIRAAYAAARRALATVGVAARAPETPYEYLDRVRRDAPSSTLRPVSTLTRLFELARFSHHPLTPAMKDEAIAAHDAVVVEVTTVRDAAWRDAEVSS
jgi:hypothetical protein